MKCFSLHLLLSASGPPVCTVSELSLSSTLLRVDAAFPDLSVKEACTRLAARPYQPVLLSLEGKGIITKAVTAGVPPSVSEALGVQVAKPSEYVLQSFGAGGATLLAVTRMTQVQEVLASLGPVARQVVSLNLHPLLLLVPFAGQVQDGPDLALLKQTGERLAAEAGVKREEAPALAHAYAWRNAPATLAHTALITAQSVRMRQTGLWYTGLRIAFPVAAVLLVGMFIGQGLLLRSVQRLTSEVDDHSALIATIESNKTLLKTRTRTFEQLNSSLVASSEAPQLLDRIAARLPGSIRFTSLAYHPSPEACEQLGYKGPPPGILVAGTADVSEQLADYVLALEKMAGIKSARIVRSQFDFREKVFVFLLEAQLDTPAP